MEAKEFVRFDPIVPTLLNLYATLFRYYPFKKALFSHFPHANSSLTLNRYSLLLGVFHSSTSLVFISAFNIFFFSYLGFR